MRRLTLGLAVVLLLPAVVGSPAWAAERFASPTGSGSTCSQGAPCTVATALTASVAGDIVTLLDGTYQGANSMVAPPTGLSGTAAAPITIRALNDGAVTIDGQFTHVPLLMNANNWWVVEGINLRNASAASAVMDMWSGAPSNNIFRRVIAHDTTNVSGQNSMGAVILVGGSTNLFEDVAAFGVGTSTIRFIVFGGIPRGSNVLRRVWARHEGALNTFNTHETLFANYTLMPDQLVENSLFTWSGEQSESAGGGVTNDYITKFNQNSATGTQRFLGSMTYLKCNAVRVEPLGAFVASPDAAGNLLVQDAIVVIENGCWTAKSGFSLRGGGAGTKTATRLSTWGGSGNDISGWTTSGINYSATFPGTNPNPWTGSGATACKRYVDGVLTNTPLWPWPMDARIKAALAAAGRTALAGTAGTGSQTHAANTVSSEIITLLGAIPDSCYTSATSPPPGPSAVSPPVPTQLATDLNVTDGTVFTIASHTAKANRLLTLAVSSTAASGSVPTPSIACHSSTWPLVASIGDGASPERKLFLFRSMLAADSTASCTIAFGSTQSAAAWSLTEWTNSDITGTFGSGAVVQSATASGGTSVAPSLGAFVNARSRPYATFRSSSNSAPTAESGWTVLSNPTPAESMGHLTMWRDATDDLTPQGNGGNPMLGIAIEVRAIDLTRPAVPAAPSTPQRPAVVCRPALGVWTCP